MRKNVGIWKLLPKWIKHGRCENNGGNICSLGYACDGCPFNKPKTWRVS